jgi:hypothetical protein
VSPVHEMDVLSMILNQSADVKTKQHHEDVQVCSKEYKYECTENDWENWKDFKKRKRPPPPPPGSLQPPLGSLQPFAHSIQHTNINTAHPRPNRPAVYPPGHPKHTPQITKWRANVNSTVF